MGFSGDVFDVTKGKGWYTPGGSYHFFAGRDAARAYATGCFKEHLTHDLRGLSDHQLKVNIYYITCNVEKKKSIGRLTA